MIHSSLKYVTVLLICFSVMQLTAQRHNHQPRIKVEKNHPFKTQTHLPTETITNTHPTPIQLHVKKDSLPGIQKIVEVNSIPGVVQPKFRISNPKKGISKKQGHIGEIPILQTRKKGITVQQKINLSSERSFYVNANSDLKKTQGFDFPLFSVFLIIIFCLLLLLAVLGVVFVILSLTSVLAMETFLSVGLVFAAVGTMGAVFLGRCLFADDDC
jgi:hypothetical protein